MFSLPPYQRNVIIGLLLSDGWLTFSNYRSKNVRLGFKQSLAHFDYVWYVFSILSHYCSSYPQWITGIRAGNRFFSLQILTRSLTCFTELYPVFYSNKIIPPDIYNLLTPVALAHLIMGEGSVERHSLKICTSSYSIQDVVRLMNVLMIRYKLECTLRIRRKKNKQNIEYMIYIRECSMSLLRTIVIPYLHPSMFYKIKS